MKQVEAVFARALREAISSVQGPLGEEAVRSMEEHWRMLRTWGRRMNLTGVRDPETAAWLLYRDALEALEKLGPCPVADVGSGGGFPGLPLAVARPKLDFVLVEPRQRRASFLRAVVARLALPNVKVVMNRSGELEREKFGTVVTKATFSDPQELYAECVRLVRPGGRVIAFRSEPFGASEVVAKPGEHSYRVQGRRRWLWVWGTDE